MTESFLILLAGGVMLAAVISDPRDVTVNWLRLAGIIALAMAALSAFFYSRREVMRQSEWILYGIVFFSILGCLCFGDSIAIHAATCVGITPCRACQNCKSVTIARNRAAPVEFAKGRQSSRRVT